MQQQERFILDLTQSHVLRYLDKIMGDKYGDYQCKVLRKAYKKYPPYEARRLLPKDVAQEVWDYICDLWADEEY